MEEYVVSVYSYSPHSGTITVYGEEASLWAPKRFWGERGLVFPGRQAEGGDGGAGCGDGYKSG